MDLAQFIVGDTAHIANLGQYLVIERLGIVTQTAQQRLARPLQGLFMMMPPGPAIIVLEQRLIRRAVCRVFDPPGFERGIECLLVDVPVDPHPGFAIDQVLPQRIGLNLWAERHITFIRPKVGHPEPGLSIGQYDLCEFVGPFAQVCRWNFPHPITGAAHGTRQPYIDGD